MGLLLLVPAKDTAAIMSGLLALGEVQEDAEQTKVCVVIRGLRCWICVWEGPLSGGCSENSLASSLGWVIVTVPSVLCAMCSPRKLVASRSYVTS